MSEMPKIWVTDFETEPVNSAPITAYGSQPPIEYDKLYHSRTPVERSQAPEFLAFDVHGLPEKRKAGLRDIFDVTGGYIIISQRFHDLLQDFDLGPTQLIELPLFEIDRKRQRPGRFWILHIVAKKSAFVPEASDNMVLLPFYRAWLPRTHDGKEVIAVQAAAAEGPDLWVDPLVSSRIFVSDRLYQAIKAEKITARSLKFKPCRVVA